MQKELKDTTLEYEVPKNKHFIYFCVIPCHLAPGFTGVTQHVGLHEV